MVIVLPWINSSTKGSTATKIDIDPDGKMVINSRIKLISKYIGGPTKQIYLI